jgi:hypothetical protein
MTLSTFPIETISPTFHPGDFHNRQPLNIQNLNSCPTGRSIRFYRKRSRKSCPPSYGKLVNLLHKLSVVHERSLYFWISLHKFALSNDFFKTVFCWEPKDLRWKNKNFRTIFFCELRRIENVIKYTK